MKAKLQIHGHSYVLIHEGKTIAFAHPEDFSNDNVIGKLSLKNCEAIKNGYDLDELAKEYKSKNGHIPTTKLEDEIFDLGFRDGFKKAIDVLGNKKFSEEDVIKALSLRDDYFKEDKSDEEIIQSLQQTEWDVEVLMSKTMLLSYPPKKIPELDSDGCLILKRV